MVLTCSASDHWIVSVSDVSVELVGLTLRSGEHGVGGILLEGGWLDAVERYLTGFQSRALAAQQAAVRPESCPIHSAHRTDEGAGMTRTARRLSRSR